MGNNTIKTHLLLHLCEDILDHGVPETVNSSYAESAHIPLAKSTSRNTQKRVVSFTKQAAKRYVEDLVVSLASADVKRDANINSAEPQLGLAIGNGNGQPQYLVGRQFDLIWKAGDESPCCRWTRSRDGDNGDIQFLSPLVSKFLSEHCLPKMPRGSLPCFKAFTHL